MLCNNVVPELSDHCEGFKGCVHGARNFTHHGFIDLNRTRLYFFGLGSLQRHKEEQALYWTEVIVHVAAGTLGAQLQSQRITSVSFFATSIYTSRELI